MRKFQRTIIEGLLLCVAMVSWAALATQRSLEPEYKGVFYRGFREGKGIWGTWEITNFAHGGFHIWPLLAGEGGQEASSAEAEEPVDAIASEALTKTAGGSASVIV